MKYLLILCLLTFASCGFHCPDLKHTYKYGEEVKIINGFYGGNVGQIIEQKIRRDKVCFLSAYKVRFWSSKTMMFQDTVVLQDDIERIKK